MSENAYEPPKSPIDPFARLGPILFTCRDRSNRDRLETMQQSTIFYDLFPLWGPLVVIAFLALGLDKLGMKPPVAVAWVVYGMIYASLCGGLYWNFLRTPSTPSLVLHESGFQFNDKPVLFDELASIEFGCKLSGVASALMATNRFLGRISPQNAAAAEHLERSQEGSMTLVYKDGTEKAMGGMLINSRPEDLKLFFERLDAICPGLVEEAPASSPSAPTVDDLPFKMTPL